MNPVDLKIVLLGKEYCGKTSLVERFIYNRFQGEFSYQNTIGAAFGAKTVEVNGQKVILGVWDTAGSERYEAMCRIYYRNAGAAIVCYDLTSSASFERTKFWVNEVNKYEPECQVYLCGTKSDLVQNDRKQRMIDYHNVTDYADEVKAVGVFETSSKNNTGVYELFLRIAEDYVSKKKDTKKQNGLEKLSIEDNKVSRYQLCC